MLLDLAFAEPGVLPLAGGTNGRRTLFGVAVPFGVASGPTENGRRYRFYGPPTNVDELVDVVREHDDDAVVGRLAGWDLAVPNALGATARLFTTTAGSDALVEASERVRTGFSVGAEVDDTDVQLADDGVYDVGRWTALHLGLVRRPAFSESTISRIAAGAAKGQRAIDANVDENDAEVYRRLAEAVDAVLALTGDPDEGEDEDDDDAQDDDADETTETTPEDPEDAETPEDDDATLADDAELVALALSVAEQRTTNQKGTTVTETIAAPAENRRRVTASRGPRTASEAAHSIALGAKRAGIVPGETDAGRINLALADVVPGDGSNGLAGAYLRPQWIDELWTPEDTRRPFVDAVGSKPLTSMSWEGWKWGERPIVGPYAGNKTPIPSNPVTILPASGTAERIAGGWDVDRIFTDLGSPDFIESMFGAAAQDYALKSEANLSAAIVAGASTPAGTAATLVEALDLIAQTLSAAGASMTFVAMASDLWSTFLSLPAAEVPWWLQAQASLDLTGTATNVAGIRVFVDASLAPGTVVGGDRRAVDFRDTGPIRLQAINIPNGGVDIALVGYQGTLIHDDRAVVAIVVAPALPLGRSGKASA